MICTTIQNKNAEQILQALEKCEMAEIRLDRCDLNFREMGEVFSSDVSLVATCRISEVMNEFGEPHIKRGYLILNGEPCRADLVFDEIYGRAQKSIFIVDNYIGLKTLEK